jgi:hypothetical protein
MTKRHVLAISLAAAALASLTVYAQHSGLFQSDPPSRANEISADLPPQLSDASGARIETAPNLPNDYGVTHADVGDADSFGRNARWLGAHTMRIALSPTCPRAGAPAGEFCHPIGNVSAASNFGFASPDPIRLPAGASTSLLCHWMSPILDISFQNSLSTRRNGTFWLRPRATIVSDALNDPGSVSSITGQPYGGKLVIEMYSHTIVKGRSIEPGASWREAERDSQICIGGLINRRALIETYGMSEELADKLFKSPMQVHFALTGGLQHVSAGYITFGTRLTGD